MGIRATNAGTLPLKYAVPEGNAGSEAPQIQEGQTVGVVTPVDLAALSRRESEANNEESRMQR